MKKQKIIIGLIAVSMLGLTNCTKKVDFEAIPETLKTQNVSKGLFDTKAEYLMALSLLVQSLIWDSCSSCGAIMNFNWGLFKANGIRISISSDQALPTTNTCLSLMKSFIPGIGWILAKLSKTLSNLVSPDIV